MPVQRGTPGVVCWLAVDRDLLGVLARYPEVGHDGHARLTYWSATMALVGVP